MLRKPPSPQQHNIPQNPKLLGLLSPYPESTSAERNKPVQKMESTTLALAADSISYTRPTDCFSIPMRLVFFLLLAFSASSTAQTQRLASDLPILKKPVGELAFAREEGMKDVNIQRYV